MTYNVMMGTLNPTHLLTYNNVTNSLARQNSSDMAPSLKHRAGKNCDLKNKIKNQIF